MELKNDRIVINDAPVDSVGGAKPEPEERPAERQADGEAAVTWGQGQAARPLPEGAKTTMATTVTSGGQVHEMFDAVSTCASCKHFNLRAGRKYTDQLRNGRSFEDRVELNVVTLALCPNIPNQDPLDGLAYVGQCDAYSRYFRDNGYKERDAVFLTTGECRCPTAVNSGSLKGKVLPRFHKNLNRAVQKILDGFRDSLRYMAMGRRG